MPDPKTAAAHTLTRTHDRLLQEVLDGLQAPQPSLPCTLFYDERGSALYDRITELEEYYPYAAEVEILERHGPDIARLVGDAPVVVEYGSGSSIKTRLLLDALPECAGYVPIDISRAHLMAAAGRIQQDYPGIAVEPVCADFTEPVTLPARFAGHDNRVAFFPGSTIGNFDPEDAVRLVADIRTAVGGRGSLLVGVDIPKDRATLELAYDDPAGVTAAFDLNILDHVNRLFDANFDPACFEHEARWNEAASRVEMHLRCIRPHAVSIAGTTLRFAPGQSIWTESSYKYAPAELRRIGERAGFDPAEVWFDSRQRYSLHLLRASA